MVRRHLAITVLTAALVAGCTAGSETTPGLTTDPSPPTTEAGYPKPAGAGDPAPPAGRAIPAPPPEPDYLPDPPPPGRPPPSFNESPGCGALQGIRGPFVAVAGSVSPGQIVAGPWGDYYGRTVGDVRDRLVRVELPTTGRPADNAVYVHERVVPALEQVVENLLLEQAKGHYYRISVTSSFRPATVPPKRYLSFHAVGAVVDVNPDTNPYRADNVLVTDMPEWFVRAWTDAGWCWGGDWQEIKDPMHFSWMGPLHSPGYEMAEPIPPATSPAGFERSLVFRTALDGVGVAVFGDVDRDGAPDVMQVGPDGALTARAVHGYRTCRAAGTVSAPDHASLALADRTGDGRPDLWQMDVRAGRLVVTVATFASGYAGLLRPIETRVPANDRPVTLVADHDRDGIDDLHVLRPGDPTVVEVWLGPDFHVRAAIDVSLPAASGSRFALGDRHGDGVPDLFALAADGRLSVLDGASGFTAVEEIATGIEGPGTLHAGDLDGDGRADLALVDGATLTVYLGGDQDGRSDADLVSWFFAEPGEPWADGQPWAPGDGCPTRPGEIR